MLSFDDDLPAVPTPPATPHRRAGVVHPLPSAGLSREPVHDLGVEQQALRDGFRRVRV